MIVGINHVQVNVSAEAMERAREFYIGFMGMREIPRPANFPGKGMWMRAGNFEMHVGIEAGVDRQATRAHVAYEVTDIQPWRSKVAEAGCKIVEQPLIPGYERFQFRDPFGNNIEIIAKAQ